MKTFFLYVTSGLLWIFIILNTIFWGTLSVLSVIISPGGKLSHGCMRYWSSTILAVMGIKIDVHGIENIDQNSVQIFAANHQSFVDIWVLNKIIPVRYGWVIKKEIGRIPFLGFHMKVNGYITIDRGNSEKARAGMEDAAVQIKNGKRIMIFPEGTRSKDGNLLPFKKGMFHLCRKTEVPVVPIYIRGTGPILKSGSMLINRGSVKVYIGRPMDTSIYADTSIEPMMDELRKRMLELIAVSEEKAA